jgi:hypothetical protein
MGKSSWVPSHTQGLFSTCCRWPVLFRVLQVLSPPSRRWGLGCRGVSASVLTWDAFVGYDYYLPMSLNIMKLCIDLCCFHETNSVCNILFWTPMDLICMLLVKCCNAWCVVLNHYDLGLYVESWLKSFKISKLPGLWEPKYRNLITSVIVFVLTFL